jgi:UDP-N-acetyl-D-galactosamine dehydrogenase
LPRYKEYSEYSKNIDIYDPWANKEKVEREYGISILNDSNMDKFKGKYDAVILCVAHKQFKGLNVRDFLNSENGVVYDVKSVLPKEQIDARL